GRTPPGPRDLRRLARARRRPHARARAVRGEEGGGGSGPDGRADAGGVAGAWSLPAGGGAGGGQVVGGGDVGDGGGWLVGAVAVHAGPGAVRHRGHADLPAVAGGVRRR
ncbi:MAG: MoxR-like ATPase in aerotolerance operon, partial [uncultured Frankineae bacterium]